jgi:hypothetical protein
LRAAADPLVLGLAAAAEGEVAAAVVARAISATLAAAVELKAAADPAEVAHVRAMPTAVDSVPVERVVVVMVVAAVTVEMVGMEAEEEE